MSVQSFPHLADQFLRQRGTPLRHYRQEWYHAYGPHYAQLDEDTLKVEIAAWYDAQELRTAVSGTRKAKPRTRNTMAELLSALRIAAQVGVLHEEGTQPLQPPFWIRDWLAEPDADRWHTFANGMLNVDAACRGEQPPLMPHVSDWFTLGSCSYSYDPHATAPRWHQFLEEILEGDRQRIEYFEEWIGYTLSPEPNYQAFLILAGSGANGKDTALGVWHYLLGATNVSALSLRDFDKQFGLDALIGKLANLSGENEFISYESAEIVKDYTGAQKPIRANRKYKPPVSFLPTAKLIFASNNLPEIKDDSEGMQRRLQILPFTYTVPPERRDSGLGTRLRAEAPGIFNRVLEARKRLLARGRFELPEASRVAAAQHRLDSHPILTFIGDHLTEEAGVVTPVDSLYHAYVAWSQSQGHKPLNNVHFGRRLSSHLAVRQMKRKKPGGYERIYPNVRYSGPVELSYEDVRVVS